MYLGGHVGGEDGEEAAREGEPDDEAHAHDPRRRHHLKEIGRNVETVIFVPRLDPLIWSQVK